MRILLFILAVLVMANSVFALDHLVISEVLYDPIGTESGGEAVEIYNPSEENINLSGYYLKTKSSAKDLVFPAVEIKPGQFFLVADINWSNKKDNITYPNADYEESFTLTNTDSGVALYYSNERIDSVGWGNVNETDLFEGQATKLASEGNSIRRISLGQDTENNSFDFIESIPDLKNSSYFENTGSIDDKEEVSISVSIANAAPEIKNISIESVEILPKPNGQRLVQINVTARDVDGFQDIIGGNISLVGEGIQKRFPLLQTRNISSNEAELTSNISFEYYDPSGNYTLLVEVSDNSSALANSSMSISYLEMVALVLDTSALAIENVLRGDNVIFKGDTDITTTSKPTIKNAGNAILDLGVIGEEITNNKDSIGLSNLTFSFGDSFSDEYSSVLSNDLTVINVGLGAGMESLQPISFRLAIPSEISKGVYTGKISIVGIAR